MVRLVHNVQKKQHKERSQTLERARYGLLEKKKDYRLRAADYHKKQAAIKALKHKSQQYNPDEYYHAMTRKKTDDRGILITDRGNEILTVDQVKLLKSQDVNYVRTLRLNEVHKIEKLKLELDFKATGEHTVFVDSIEEQGALTPEKFFDTDAKLLGRRENRLKIAQLQTNEALIKQKSLENPEELLALQQEKLKKYNLLEKRIQREQELLKVEQEMEKTRELMKNGSKKKIISSTGKALFKWKNERKR